MEIAIIAPDNGVGLTRDRNIVYKLIKDAGYSVDLIDSHSTTLQNTNKPYSHAIFLEVINYKYFKTGQKNIGIFNPDWFHPQWMNSLRRFEVALCKTKHSMNIFNKIKTDYIGFTSVDRYLKNDDKNTNEILHIAGRSRFKGTDQLIRLWDDTLPILNIYSYGDCDFRSLVNSKNIKYHYGRLDDLELKLIQNKYLYHLQPSIMEGFGHIINESLSTEAIVITTNASPMNELTNTHLINVERQGKFNLAIVCRMNKQSLIDSINNLTPNLQIGVNNRLKFLERNEYFNNNFINKLEQYL